jgi:cytochrome P450
VDQLRPKIQALADSLIDPHEGKRAMDFMADFAYPLPFTVICDILNVPESDRPPLADYTHWLMRTTDPTPMSRDETDLANRAAIGFRDAFTVLATERRARPTDDIFSDLANATTSGIINEEELVANLILIFCAGHDTVVNLFGNGLLALHRHPTELARLKSDRTLMKNAVEELLRYDASVQIARRSAFEAVEIGGRQIAEGHYVLCCLGAANRDPEVFPDPDKLDIGRPNIRPMSFGGGIHYCLGAFLARVQGEIVFDTIIRRMPELRLETLRPEWHQNVFVRGLRSLPVTW